VGITTVNPSSVATDGTSLQVVVPANATSGMVRLGRESAGLFLQVVPTLTDVQGSVNNPFHNQQLRLHGSGFMEGNVTIHFGNQSLADSGVFGGPDAGYMYSQDNDGINLTVPNGVPFGPISVTTLGGTSPAFNVTFSKIVGVAGSGTPADGTQASANPGQAITLQGSGLSFTTDVVLPVIDDSGTVSERVVQPVLVDETGSQMTVLVPADAFTGNVGVVG